MALSADAKRDRKIVDQFLNDVPTRGSGFLSQLDSQITQNRAQRRAAQQVNRIIGAGAFEGNSPFRNTPALNPTGAGGRQILQQGMGPVQAIQGPGQQVLPGMGGNAPRPAPVSMGPQVTPGSAARPMQMGPLGSGGTAFPPQQGQLPFNQAANVGTTGTPTRGPIAGTARVAAAEADDFVRYAGEAAAQGADDVAAAASRQAGQKTAQAMAGKSPTGIIRAGGSAPKPPPGFLGGVGKNLGINVTKSGIMKGAGMAGTGLMVSQFIDGMNIGGEQSFLDKAGSGAILGAGLGGGAALALGLGSGPVGWAALGGAAMIGAGRALFGGDDTKKETAMKSVDETRETIAGLGEMYGLEGEAMQDIMLQYEASTQMYLQNDDIGGLKNFMAGMGTQLPALMLAAREQQKAGDQEQQRYESMMQTQAQFAPIFEQSLNRAAQANQMSYAQANNTATYLDQRQPQLAQLFRTTAAQSQAAAANLHAAYAKQVATAPVTAGTTDQLQRQMAQEELMNQQLQQSAQYAGF